MTPAMPAGNKMTPAQLNAQARSLINALAVPREQIIKTLGIAAVGTQNISQSFPIVNITPRMVGLIRGFVVEIQATITNGSAVQIDLTDFGPANLLTQIQFQDLQNNTRIQTPGWHLMMINSVRGRRPFGTSLVRGTGFDSPMNFGSNFHQSDFGSGNDCAGRFRRHHDVVLRAPGVLGKGSPWGDLCKRG